VARKFKSDSLLELNRRCGSNAAVQALRSSQHAVREGSANRLGDHLRRDLHIVDHCCEVWNKLMDQPWKIMSIRLRDWAHRS
jgi:hypothetical protein